MKDSLTYTKLPLGYRLLAYMGLMRHDPNEIMPFGGMSVGPVGCRLRDFKQTDKVQVCQVGTGRVIREYKRNPRLSEEEGVPCTREDRRKLAVAVCNTLLASA